MYHKYYQWVVFVLFLQATMFHLPREVWKHAEGGLMKILVGDLTDPQYLIKVKNIFSEGLVNSLISER